MWRTSIYLHEFSNNANVIYTAEIWTKGEGLFRLLLLKQKMPLITLAYLVLLRSIWMATSVLFTLFNRFNHSCMCCKVDFAAWYPWVYDQFVSQHAREGGTNIVAAYLADNSSICCHAFNVIPDVFSGGIGATANAKDRYAGGGGLTSYIRVDRPIRFCKNK